MQLHIAHAVIHLNMPHPGNDEQFSFIPGVLAEKEMQARTDLTPPAMGEYWPGQGGRYICTLPALLDMPERHLIAAEGETEDLTFGPSEDVQGAASQIDGTANTKALLAHGKHPAALCASAYTADGHTDFFLPSKLDMVMAHICAPQLFKKSGWYWTSTQGSRSFAFVQDFENGISDWYYKDYDHRVRAFRVIPLNA
ncbi:MAG: DUF1566 domain-containing protein [Rhodoferax sp.]|nr:DUF1566 domain-containing protein [Rhodoferax sp.]MDP3651079.1 DUF1566 domain-containing protein [Rhodoferax sp.]